MKDRNLESIANELVDHLNDVLKESAIANAYTLTISDGEREIPFININKGNKVESRKQYYGQLLFTLKENEQEIILFKKEYLFYNLTDKFKDLLWKEKLLKVFLYECMGTFAAVSRIQHIQQKKQIELKEKVEELKKSVPTEKETTEQDAVKA